MLTEDSRFASGSKKQLRVVLLAGEGRHTKGAVTALPDVFHKACVKQSNAEGPFSFVVLMSKEGLPDLVAVTEIRLLDPVECIG